MILLTVYNLLISHTDTKVKEVNSAKKKLYFV